MVEQKETTKKCNCGQTIQSGKENCDYCTAVQSTKIMKKQFIDQLCVQANLYFKLKNKETDPAKKTEYESIFNRLFAEILLKMSDHYDDIQRANFEHFQKFFKNLVEKGSYSKIPNAQLALKSGRDHKVAEAGWNETLKVFEAVYCL